MSFHVTPGNNSYVEDLMEQLTSITTGYVKYYPTEEDIIRAYE